MNQPKKNRTADTRSKLEDCKLKHVVARPYDQSNPQDCPPQQPKKTELLKRLKWLWTLSNDDLKHLVASHQPRPTPSSGTKPAAGVNPGTDPV